MARHIGRFVFDANVILDFLNGDTAADRAAEILLAHQEGTAAAYMSPVNLGEVYYVIARRSGAQTAERALERVRDLRMIMPPVGARQALVAADLRARTKLPYADAIAAALARDLDAVLLTRDHDFKVVSHLIKIEWI